MKNKIFVVVLLAAFVLCTLGGCNRPTDNPPKETSPEPAAPTGTFASEYGSMIFNGDGESVSFSFTEALAELAAQTESGELPVLEGEGTYAFTFNGGLWRYDQADQLRIYAGEETLDFRNEHGQTSETCIVLTLWDVPEKQLKFEKK